MSGQHVQFFDLQPDWFPVVARYTLRKQRIGDGYEWVLTSVRQCYSGVRWSYWKRVRNFGIRWVWRLHTLGVPLWFKDCEPTWGIIERARS